MDSFMSKFSFLANGSPTKEFKIEKGLRQGDPLSPFLFILAVKALNVVFLEARNKNIFHGVDVGNDKIPISHFQFADDALIIGQWREFCSKERRLKRLLEKDGRVLFDSLNLDSKKWKVCSLTTMGSVIHKPLIAIPFILDRFLQLLIMPWKSASCLTISVLKSTSVLRRGFCSALRSISCIFLLRSVATAESEIRKEHERHLRLILKLLTEEELYAKFSKYEFWLSKVQFIGHMIDSEGIHVDPAKIESIKNWAAPILDLPEGSENFVVYCDASHKGLGAVLMQKEKVIAYASYQLKVHKKNYTTHDLKFGAVVFALKTWRHYLYGTKCIVFTDHKSLQHILDRKELNMRQRCWLELLSEYDYDTLEKLTRQYLKEVVSRNGVPTDGQSERTIQTLEDMLRAYVLNFGKSWDTHLPLVEFSYNNSYHTSIKAAPFEALYGCKCRSPICWAKLGDSQLTGPEIIHETTEKIVQIKSRIQAARDRQKSYADVRRKPLEFQVRDKVMLKVSPWKEVRHFGKRGKLNPRYIGPFKIIAKVGTVAYRLELSEKLSRVHSTFHVSKLKKCMADEPLAIPLDEIQVDDKLNFIEEPVEVMDREVKCLKQSRISIVKVCWNSRRGPEFTCERKDQMQKKYPHLSTNSAPAAEVAS
nr:putative reverse transcriptase domain-containing protein [Tanacetum cinerariifolium]